MANPILFERALLLAKLEEVFRTDSLPTETLKTTTSIDSTTDSDPATDELTETAHGYITGEGPVRLTLVSGAFPVATPAFSATTDYFVRRITANTFELYTTRAGALLGTTPIDITADAVGTFTMSKVSSDAFLVIEPDFAPDITVLDRENVKTHLSELPGATGRKIAQVTFRHEVRNAGLTSPVGDKRPALGTLLLGCGWAETKYLTTGTILDNAPVMVAGATTVLPVGRFTYTKTTAFTGTLPRTVELVCTTGGGSGTAQFTVRTPAVGDVQAAIENLAQTMTNATPFTLVESAQITPTITTSFVAGDRFVIHLAPPGFYYTPVSTGFESLSLYIYFDGLLHKMTGSRGTWTLEAASNSFATMTFTFTGDFVSVVDAAMPLAPVFEATIPRAVEQSAVHALVGPATVSPNQFAWAQLCAQSFTIDNGNEVVARECINEKESLAGAIITDRSMVATFNPETTLEANHPFWDALEDADRVVWGGRVGVAQGNVVAFQAVFAQYTGLSYVNRDGIRAYDVNLRLATDIDQSGLGNDELRIVFC